MPDERVSGCLMRPLAGVSHVAIHRTETGRASFGNLMVCGSVWMCPICSARISEHRRRELNHALAWARQPGEDGHPRAVPILLTLTARHRLGDELGSLLGALKEALRMLRRSRAWAALKPELVGSITATEVTHGSNGWHPHFHVLLFLRGRGADVSDLLARRLPAEWLRSLGRVTVSGRGDDRPLDGEEHRAFQWQSAEAAGDYVAKFGAADEIALGPRKLGRSSSRSWLQLLADSARDPRAGELFRTYALAFKGRRQLSWSPGFKDLVQLAELSDQEAAELELEPTELLVLIPVDQWRRLVAIPGARTALLDAAELGGADAVAGAIRLMLSREPPP